MYVILGQNNIESCSISVSCLPIPSRIYVNAADAQNAAETEIIDGNIDVALIVFPPPKSGLQNAMGEALKLYSKPPLIFILYFYQHVHHLNHSSR